MVTLWKSLSETSNKYIILSGVDCDLIALLEDDTGMEVEFRFLI